MKKKKIIVIALVCLLILFLPIPRGPYDDGGTREYSALTYKIVKWSRTVSVYDEEGTVDRVDIYRNTSIYWFPNNFKSTEELWKTEYKKQDAAPSGERPFQSLTADEIASASVRMSPPFQTVEITDLCELTEYLNDVVIYEEDNAYSEYDGQACTFTVTKTDGTVMTIMAYNPFLVIDGVGYRCAYEPCEALNNYANRLCND